MIGLLIGIVIGVAIAPTYSKVRAILAPHGINLPGTKVLGGEKTEA